MPRPRNLPRARLSCLPRREAVPIGQRQRLVQQVGEIAAVIGRAVRRLVRHRPRARMWLLPAQFDPVDADLARGRIDQPLHVVIGLGPSGAAIGPDRRRVGEHAFGVHLDQRRLVDAQACCAARCASTGPERRRSRRDCRIRSAAPPGNCRPRRAPARRSSACVAAMRVGDKAAGAVVGPFDRAAELARRVQDAVIFRHRSAASCRTSRRPGR